jgi:hypothetical protein
VKHAVHSDFRLQEYFARIHQSLWVDQVFDGFHQIVSGAVFQLHELAFSNPDTVFAMMGPFRRSIFDLSGFHGIAEQ